MSKRTHIRIDAQHAKDLLAGKAVAFKVPTDATVLEISLAANALPKEWLDTFFNGRPR
jgi:hypothetical protein